MKGRDGVQRQVDIYYYYYQCYVFLSVIIVDTPLFKCKYSPVFITDLSDLFTVCMQYTCAVCMLVPGGVLMG